MNFQDSTVARGCIKDLDAEKHGFCEKQTDKCHLCWDEDSCNTLMPGKSTNLNSSGILIALIVSIASFVSIK